MTKGSVFFLFALATREIPLLPQASHNPDYLPDYLRIDAVAEAKRFRHGRERGAKNQNIALQCAESAEIVSAALLHDVDRLSPFGTGKRCPWILALAVDD